ncbi:hypothetical protein AB835_06285 [Candidatus Endobugula sertula]|uniref:Uncharacterized protein n=1 Tax=Candidatus Endobugula sertula TaxID=62101 RepID=A0A1D2QQW0_9GAMM|nr:hypothetical protein AB835_06285 [Candidatus Endobugula sertula]
MQQWINNQKVRIWVPPTVGFLVYGCWALYINSSHGWMSAGKAAFTQGSYSFVVTLVLAVSVEWLFTRWLTVPLCSLWVFLVALTLLSFTSTGLHILAGTPNVLWTILPGLSISAVYTLIYVVALNKL